MNTTNNINNFERLKLNSMHQSPSKINLD